MSDFEELPGFAASGDLPTRRLGGRVYIVTSRLAAFVNGEGEAA